MDFCRRRIVDLRRGIRGSSDTRMAAVFKEEWRLFGRRMCAIIISKLGGCKPISPIGLHIICIQPQVLLQILIDSFRLTVSLRMISRAKRSSNAQQLDWLRFGSAAGSNPV